MMVEITLEQKVQKAIDRLRSYESIALAFNPDGFYLAFSGGKDSQCIYHLAIEAGVKFKAYNHHTTVDPPELVQFLRKNYPDVIIQYPKRSMWKLIEDKHMPPSRKARYCCEVLKEGGGEGMLCVTGVRWAESRKRKANRSVSEIIGSKIVNKMLFSDDDDDRQMFENCLKKGKRILNPIVDWEDSDVWDYIKSRGIQYCSLYDEGFDRLGCIGCPLANIKWREREFERWPSYKRAFIKSFDKVAVYRETTGMNMNKRVNKKKGQDIFDWWMGYTKAPEEQYEGQEEWDEP